MRLIFRLLIVVLIITSSISAYSQGKQKLDKYNMISTYTKVWGFLKYYHPEVGKGKMDWDSVFVNQISSIIKAKDKSYFNREINELLIHLGEIDECKNCTTWFPDKMLINYDFKWLEDTCILDKSTINKLKYIKANKKPYKNYYVRERKNVGSTKYENEKPYKDIALPNTEYRLLTLARYWNIIHYFFPYKYLMDENWNNVLQNFIPEFICADDALSYHLTTLKLIVKINDGHACSYGNVLNNYFRKRFLPFELDYIEGKTIITKMRSDSLAQFDGYQIGDIVFEIDNVPINKVRNKFRKYSCASNESTINNRVNFYLQGGNKDSVKLKILRNKDTLTFNRRRYKPIHLFAKKSKNSTSAKFNIINDNIGYIDLGKLLPSDVDKVMKTLISKKAIIFDVRNYPNETVYDLSKYLLPSMKQFFHVTIPHLDYPGVYKILDGDSCAGPKEYNKDYYKGLVIILVNSITQSHSEFTCMALQCAPNSIVIGSETAGADGNVSDLILPGNISTSFSGIGIYYPNGEETQRIGIKPDIFVNCTIDGFLNNKDEVLEKAIEYINNR